SPVQVITIEPSFYRTPIISHQMFRSTRERILAETPASIRAAYNVKKVNHQLDLMLDRAQLMARPNVSEVTDALMKAVTLKHPKAYYRCCGWAELHIWAVAHVPEVLLDFILSLQK